VIKAVKVEAASKIDDRCLTLHVNEVGVVTYVSDTPTTLFSFQPSLLMGKPVAEVVDVLATWEQEGNNVLEALGAFLIKSLNAPGCSWRVGVVPQYSAEAANNKGGILGGVGSASSRYYGAQGSRMLNAQESRLSHMTSGLGAEGSMDESAMRKMHALHRAKPAVMQVEQVDGNDGKNGQPVTEPQLRVRLWRPEAVTCVMEIGEGLSVSRVDAAAALVFGVSHTQLLHQNLGTLMRLPPGSTLPSLIGAANSKGKPSAMKGGVNKALVGPRRTFEAQHADRGPLQVTLQVVPRDGKNLKRGMALLKIASVVKGTPRVIKQLMDEELSDVDDELSDVPGHTAKSTVGPLPDFKGSPGARGLLRKPSGLAKQGTGLLKKQISRLNSGLAAAGGAVALNGREALNHLMSGKLSRKATDLEGNGPMVPTLNLSALNAMVKDAADAAKALPPPSARVEEDDDGLITARDIGLDLGVAALTARTVEGGDGMVTARDVDLDLATARGDKKGRPSSGKPPRPGSGRPGSGQPGSRPLSANRLKSPSALQKARMAESPGSNPPNMSDDSAMNTDAVTRKHTRWGDIGEADPDAVPMPGDDAYNDLDAADEAAHRVRDELGDISEGDEDGDDDKPRTQRLKTRNLDAAHAVAVQGLGGKQRETAKHGILTTKEWLEGDYKRNGGTAGDEGDTGHSGLPTEKVRQAEARRAGGGLLAALAAGAEAAKDDDVDRQETALYVEDDDEELVVDAGKADAAAADLAGGASSDFSRGKRLKRLLKLIAGKQATAALHTLRTHMYGTVAAMVLLHVACFIALLAYINRQKAYIINISAAGEALDHIHAAGMYSRAIHAAYANYTFTRADIPKFRASLTEELDEFERLHQGLYLGFGKGVSAASGTELSPLWNKPDLGVTSYSEAFPPVASVEQRPLWVIGNTLVSSGREVVALSERIDAGTQVNVTDAADTVGGSRFWLWVRDNCGGSIYDGYLHVINTVLVQGQDNIEKLHLLLLILLIVEVALSGVVASGYVVLLFMNVAKSRSALFTVFLVIPSPLLKMLSSKAVELEEEDSDDEEEAEGGAGAGGGGGDDDDGPDAAEALLDNMVGDLDDGATEMGNSRRNSFAGVPPPGRARRASFDLPTNRSENDLKNVGAMRGRLASKSGMLTRLRRALSGEVDPARDVFNGKRLVKTKADVIRLIVPFAAWAAVLLGVYVYSLTTMSSVQDTLVNLKMLDRAQGQVTRTAFFLNEFALENATALDLRTRHRNMVLAESIRLEAVYQTALYGGDTLKDSSTDGAHDASSGSLFVKKSHAQALFYAKGCLREDDPLYGPCLDKTSYFYEISSNGIDPMVRRLIQEGTYAGQEDLADMTPQSKRWQFVWDVVRLDTRSALAMLADTYHTDALATFKLQSTIHIVVLVVLLCCAAAYLVLLFRPYVKLSATEAHRVAELLSQLPPDVDVEGMVEASWKAVRNEALDRDAAGLGPSSFRSFTTQAGGMSFASAIGRSFTAMKRMFNGAPEAPAGGSGSRHSKAGGSHDMRDDSGEVVTEVQVITSPTVAKGLAAHAPVSNDSARLLKLGSGSSTGGSGAGTPKGAMPAIPRLALKGLLAEQAAAHEAGKQQGPMPHFIRKGVDPHTGEEITHSAARFSVDADSGALAGGYTPRGGAGNSTGRRQSVDANSGRVGSNLGPGGVRRASMEGPPGSPVGGMRGISPAGTPNGSGKFGSIMRRLSLDKARVVPEGGPGLAAEDSGNAPWEAITGRGGAESGRYGDLPRMDTIASEDGFPKSGIPTGRPDRLRTPEAAVDLARFNRVMTLERTVGTPPTNSPRTSAAHNVPTGPPDRMMTPEAAVDLQRFNRVMTIERQPATPPARAQNVPTGPPDRMATPEAAVDLQRFNRVMTIERQQATPPAPSTGPTAQWLVPPPADRLITPDDPGSYSFNRVMTIPLDEPHAAANAPAEAAESLVGHTLTGPGSLPAAQPPR